MKNYVCNSIQITMIRQIPMKGFKDFLAEDIQRTFLNQNEFADPYIIDGVEVKASLDSVSDSRHPLAYAEGVALVTHVLFVSMTELGYKPEPEQRMVIKDQRYRVDQVAEEMGMLTISLEANVT
ncbi:hypothetical protein [Paenibacillus monticola]|uniref:Uncharacterized protein n=1 Tax=Paenibacillus monticola TaxID=2666075 RepID=A0A7X2H1U1_9BACL|nr:hypothetical protein [Paenibacillus monticola]MRN51986.1 hypothetical protein [Paenibacillus monticola]